jgi:hypothetical protein
MSLTFTQPEIDLSTVQWRRKIVLASVTLLIAILLPFVCAVWLHTNPFICANRACRHFLDLRRDRRPHLERIAYRRQ